MVQEPQRRLRKYGREVLDVPQDSRPVEMTPGIMTTGWVARRPWAASERPTEKES